MRGEQDSDVTVDGGRRRWRARATVIGLMVAGAGSCGGRECPATAKRR